ncbi:MAG: cysteine--tRNA ligase [Pseudomonadales bacterium]|nr:cysteine--tRNA ligase [Pseudomonadales bacterium]
MALHLYNTRHREKELFEPQDPQRISMYVCGPTVYNRVHIGNARPAVVFDTLFRVLKSLYPEVIYARNITDIDDKIIAAAKTAGESIEAISARFAQAYFEDMADLHNQTPTIQPYATEHIEQMIHMVQRLVDKGHAYAVDADHDAAGHVLFAVQSMSDYGQLSNRSLDDMLAGARVEVADYKKYAGDFVLWKPSADDEPGWDSPWGRGRPGWHLECSAMIETHLGDTIDIHGGGRDLVFPHHENEVAQSQCAHDGKLFVRYWMHNGYINIDGEKMSKSLGNFKMVRDLLDHYAGETLRFALLSAQYRSELSFSVDLLDQAKAALDTLYGALKQVENVVAIAPSDVSEQPAYKALLDDLNTPIAIRELHSLAKLMTQATGAEQAHLKGQLLACAELLGLLQQSSSDWFQQAVSAGAMSVEQIESLMAARQQAKLDKNYAGADEIRAELLAAGVVLEDSREGTTWRRE